MNIDNSRIMQGVKDNFTNINSLDDVKAMGRRKDPEALRRIAEQFESMFMQQLLKVMRSTNDVFSQGNELNSSETQFHQQMFDHQMALEMSAGRGTGLADVLFRQMSAQFSSEFLTDTKDKQSTEVSRSRLSDIRAVNQAPNNLSLYQSVPENLAGKKGSVAVSAQTFIQQMLPQAQRAAEKLNLSAEVLLAQAALETGWGKHVIHTEQGENSYNLFNIKADKSWGGLQVKVPTLEYRNGIAEKEQASFRQYNSYADSFDDYVDFIQSNPRYKNALQQTSDARAYTSELQRAGYATDPKYSEKINRIMNSEIIQNSSKNSLALLGAEGSL